VWNSENVPEKRDPFSLLQGEGREHTDAFAGKKGVDGNPRPTGIDHVARRQVTVSCDIAIPVEKRRRGTRSGEESIFPARKSFSKREERVTLKDFLLRLMRETGGKRLTIKTASKKKKGVPFTASGKVCKATASREKRGETTRGKSALYQPAEEKSMIEKKGGASQ